MTRTPLARLLSTVLADAPVAIEAYDGSRSGPADAPVVLNLRTPRALSYLISAPSSLGLARAFVSGELEIRGDLYDALTAVWSDHIGNLSWQERLHVLRNLDPKAMR